MLLKDVGGSKMSIFYQYLVIFNTVNRLLFVLFLTWDIFFLTTIVASVEKILNPSEVLYIIINGVYFVSPLMKKTKWPVNVLYIVKGNTQLILW